jgi:hypothetical protein
VVGGTTPDGGVRQPPQEKRQRRARVAEIAAAGQMEDHGRRLIIGPRQRQAHHHHRLHGDGVHRVRGLPVDQAYQAFPRRRDGSRSQRAPLHVEGARLHAERTDLVQPAARPGRHHHAFRQVPQLGDERGEMREGEPVLGDDHQDLPPRTGTDRRHGRELPQFASPSAIRSDGWQALPGRRRGDSGPVRSAWARPRLLPWVRVTGAEAQIDALGGGIEADRPIRAIRGAAAGNSQTAAPAVTLPPIAAGTGVGAGGRREEDVAASLSHVLACAPPQRRLRTTCPTGLGRVGVLPLDARALG